MKKEMEQIKEYVPYEKNVRYTKEQILKLISKEIYTTEITIKNLCKYSYTKQIKTDLINEYNTLRNVYSEITRSNNNEYMIGE